MIQKSLSKPWVAPTSLEYVGYCELPTQWGSFKLHGFIDADTGKEHLAIAMGDLTGGEPVLTRVHSECLTGDALFSQRCDCGAQLEDALQRIAQIGRGVLLYLRQEGRGIGLINKIRAYQLQDAGADTLEANERLGFQADQRRYELCRPMFEKLCIREIRLMTNNPEKIAALQACGIKVHERLPILAGHCRSNTFYLKTKREKFGHLL